MFFFTASATSDRLIVRFNKKKKIAFFGDNGLFFLHCLVVKKKNCSFHFCQLNDKCLLKSFEKIR